MKVLFSLIFLIDICYCVKHNYGSSIFWEKDTEYGVNHTDGKSDDQNPGSLHDPIIRPCPLHDLNCIRQFFAHNSQCSPARGSAPDPYMLPRLDLRIPHANITFALVDAQVKGLNEWKIMEFFINKATDRLVLEVVFDRIVVACPGFQLTYHRKGKEPLEVSDYSIIEYYGLSFTVTIPNIKDLQLSRGYVYPYIPEADPKYTLGPAVSKIKDPGFILAVRKWLTDLSLTLQEIFMYQGPAFMSVFLQSTICDFNLD